ncbi:MAG: ABC transporter permease [Gaiellaceae bacterium]
MRIERRLRQPRWLSIVVPAGSVLLALAASALVLTLTGHSPGGTFRRLFDAAFLGTTPLNDTITSATPLIFTGLCAAAAFRMGLFNIGGEGQLYIGAITGAAAGLLLGNHTGWLSVPLMIAAGALGGAAFALVPGILRAVLSTNEIITSLMLNYVAALVLDYLIFDSQSYLRDTSTPEARVFPQGKTLPDAAIWPGSHLGSLVLPFGFLLAILLAGLLWLLYERTSFGFEVRVIGDSPRTARYAGLRARRKILLVMAISGALAGIGGASQDGDFRYVLDPRGLTAASYGYAGIVVAALGRYNPFVVVLIGFLLGGLQNAGYTLQGADFPSGLVGVMQGLILFCALAGELLIRYRIRLPQRARARQEAVT